MSLVAVCLYGLAGGILYPFSDGLIAVPWRLVRLPVAAARFCLSPTRKQLRLLCGQPEGKRGGAFSHHIGDFLFFLVFGIGYILLLYAALDGVFRLYLAALLCLFFLFGKRTLGNRLGAILRATGRGIYAVLLTAVATLMFIPLRLSLIFCGHVLKPICHRIRAFRSRRLSARLMKKKTKKCKSLFLSTEKYRRAQIRNGKSG